MTLSRLQKQDLKEGVPYSTLWVPRFLDSLIKLVASLLHPPEVASEEECAVA